MLQQLRFHLAGVALGAHKTGQEDIRAYRSAGVIVSIPLTLTRHQPRVEQLSS